MTALTLTALLNGVWQGALLVALVALALRLWPQRNAATACALWTATYFLVAALPLIDVATAHPAQALAASVAVHRAGFVISRAAPFTVLLWTSAAVVLLVRLLWRFAVVLELKTDAKPLDAPGAALDLRRGRPVALGASARVRVPCAIGFVRPMIVVPTALADALEPADLTRVIVHEHAHLRRYDDWLNAAQRIVGALLFFHPVLHDVARRIDFEREVACDDVVLHAIGHPLAYAECLTNIVDRQLRGRRIAVVPGFFVGRSQVLARVDRLIDASRDVSPRIAASGPLLAAVLLFTAFGLAQLQMPVVAAPTAFQPPRCTEGADAATTAAARIQPRSVSSAQVSAINDAAVTVRTASTE